MWHRDLIGYSFTIVGMGKSKTEILQTNLPVKGLSSVLTNFPAIFCSVESIVSLLTAINLADRCTGNADEKLHALL